MTYVKAWLGTVIPFFVVDIVWIVAVVQPFYEREVGQLLRESPNMAASVLFYLAYSAGIVVLAVRPALGSGTATTALVNGAVLGAIAYGTYTVTNYAVLTGWTTALVVSDIAWGAFLTGLCAACGYLVARPRP